jgi:hypothetical protein
MRTVQVSRLFSLSIVGVVAACTPDYDLIPDPNLETIDTSVDTPIDTDEEPPGDRPVAVCEATPDEVQPPFDTNQFLGGGSYDPAGHPITTYIWSIAEAPTGSDASLSPGPTNADRNFQADLAGTYTARLIVKTDDDRSSAPCEVSIEAIPSQDLWVEMYWTHSGDDMDLHLLAPSGTPTSNLDCYYGNTNPNWGGSGTQDDPQLDLDDIPNTGPENINMGTPSAGTYKVVVHDYPGSVNNSPNDTTINVYVGGSLVWSDTRSLTTEGTYYYYAMIDWPSGDVLDCPSTGC